MSVKNEKEVNMEGQDWTSRVARSQAALNKQGASCKSRLQAYIYAAEIADIDEKEFEQMVDLVTRDFKRVIQRAIAHRRLLQSKEA